MFSQVPKFLLIFLTASAVAMVMTSSMARANEGKEEKKEGEAPKEEKKEVKSTEESYSVVLARVQTLEAKVHSGQEEIEKLIEEKQATKDPAKVSEIIKQMVSLHKDLQKNAKDYDQQRALLKYRYPEKGLSDKREYERIDIKSIEDMESQTSLATSVKHTLKKVRMQYDTPEEAKARNENPVKPTATPQPSLTDPVILKK
ncbi:MAG TPA: hypothetical protein VN132_16710 [Bdellovibrio sp.]|nr:hypothetical protein [Bdellovibrio sp.]